MSASFVFQDRMTLGNLRHVLRQLEDIEDTRPFEIHVLETTARTRRDACFGITVPNAVAEVGVLPEQEKP